MAGSLCLCSREDYGEGLPKWSSSPLKHSAASRGAVGSGWDLFRVGYTTHFLGAPPDDRMLIIASERKLSLSGDDDSAALPASGVVALSEPDQEMMDMLSRVVSRWRLHWFSTPPSGAILAEVHEELTRSWKAPFTARKQIL